MTYHSPHGHVRAALTQFPALNLPTRQPDNDADERPIGARIGLLLMPGFPMEELALFASALEKANSRLGRLAMKIEMLSESGDLVPSNMGGFVQTKLLSSTNIEYDYLFVFSQPDSEVCNRMRFSAVLNRLQQNSCIIGAIGGAVILLAQIGLLEKEPIAVHWQRRTMLREMALDAQTSDKLYETSGRIWTSCGQIATIDLAMHLVAQVYGGAAASELAQELMHSRLYNTEATQNEEIRGVPITSSPVINRAIAVFRDHLEEPIRIRVVAAHVGISQRSLERQFVTAFGMTPRKYYEGLRVALAHDMVLRSQLPLLDVALATGFSSTDTLSVTYRRHYGETPYAMRRSMRFPTCGREGS
jgi:AraC family carnitine catabolism transcriptional activator